MKTPQPETVLQNSFAALIAELRDGAAQSEASEKLTALIQRVQETGRAGKLVLEVKIAAANRGRAVNISDTISLKLPALPAEETLLFVDSKNGFRLCRDNPEQRHLDLQEVPRAAAEIKPAVSA